MNKSTSGGYIKGLGKRANAVLSILVLLLSACMMLNYLEEYEAEEKLSSAILDVLNEAQILTPDLGGKSSTTAVSEEVKSKIMVKK